MVLVILGGIISLGATFLVQVFVIPRVQAWTRGRERWENDMRSLVAHLEEELPRLLRSDRVASSIARSDRLLRKAEGVNPDNVASLARDSTERVRLAQEALGEHMAQLSFLVNRVKIMRKNAPCWKQLDYAWTKLRTTLLLAEDRSPEDIDEERIRQLDAASDKAWGDVEHARKQLLGVVKPIADRIPMKLPDRRFMA